MLNSSLVEQLKAFSPHFKENYPFPFIVLDDFLQDSNFLKAIALEFSDELDYFYSPEKYPFEPFKQVSEAPNQLYQPHMYTLSKYLASKEFVNFLENLTGENGLFIDSSFHGGFAQQSPNGGRLGVHLDREVHKHHPNWVRTITLIIYLNDFWTESWNGDLQLWVKHSTDPYIVDQCVTRIFPLLNRAVIFKNTSCSYHGFPLRIKCPESITRKCLVSYFYRNQETSLQRGGGRYFITQFDQDSEELRKYIDSRSDGATSV